MIPENPTNHVEASFVVEGDDVDLDLITARLGAKIPALNWLLDVDLYIEN